MYVDGTLVINAWVDQGPTTYTATRTLTAGVHQVRVEYYEREVGAVAQVSWSGAPPPPTCPVGQYQAEYYSGQALAGSPLLTRCEATINNTWPNGSGPGAPVPTDDFSVRWVGQFTFPAGATTFSATADDGIRVWVDGSLVIDAWIDQGATTYTATRTLTAGQHEVRVEYYDNSWDAVAIVSW